MKLQRNNTRSPLTTERKMIKNKKRFPVLIPVSVILPGIIISILGIYHVSGQKISRELNLQDNFRKELNILRENIESRFLKVTEKAFTEIQKNPIDPENPESILKTVKRAVINNAVVKYPFLIDKNNRFIFPLTRKTEVKKSESTDLAAIDPGIKNIYYKGNSLEFSERQYVTAIKFYLRCLELKPSKRVYPYILNSIARSYFKLNKFFQSSYYYRKILNEYSAYAKTNTSLYLTILRQVALTNKYLGKSGEALKFYLRLYENIIRFESTSGSVEFELYKNEALDLISRSRENITPVLKGDKVTKTIRELQNISDLDMRLRWRYVDLNTGDSDPVRNGNGELKASILKLQELYTPSDEKSKFFQVFRELLIKSKIPREEKISIYPVTLPPGMNREICYKLIDPSLKNQSGLTFGFMISEDILKKSLFDEMPENIFSSGGLKLLIIKNNNKDLINTGTPHPYPLMSVPFRKILQGNSLSIYSREKDFFSNKAKKDMQISYILIFALIVSLFLGTILFYKYFSREIEILRSKSEFVDRVSHTLKTPLTRLRLMAENISSGWINDETKKNEFIENIIRETGRMNETIDNMLNFSNIEEGKKQYHFENIKIQIITKKILDRYRDELGSYGFILEENMERNLPPLPVDLEAFKLILSNLLQNSIKYSTGEKYISIKIFREGLYTILEVKDKGIGIADKDQSEIFNKFFRSIDKNVIAREGSGLGLFIVEHAVKAHNGKIKIKSKPGEGTTISILFPNQDKDMENNEG